MSIKRDIITKIKKYFSSEEILLIVGARQAGKTTLLHQIEDILKEQGEICYFLNLEDPDYSELLNKSPKNLFKIFPFNSVKRSCVLLDEVQYLKNPTNFLKYIYDEHKGKVKIIASGSSAFYLDKKFEDSLVGRKKIFELYTLSFREFLRFKGEDRFSEKSFGGLSLSEREKLLRYYQEYIIFGGYPRVVLATLQEKEDILRDIVYSYIKKDVFEANIRQDEVFYKLLKILASQIGNLVNASELASSLGISKTAVDNYLYVMQKSFHIALIKPFFKNIRKEIIKMPKVYFYDFGLRNFLTKNFGPFWEREDKGPLLENVLFRNFLQNYKIEDIHFWRTSQGSELDFVVDSAGFEVKVEPSNFKKKKYEEFLEKYPEIKIQIVSLETKTEEVGSFKVKELWNME
jgi:uncharacterized protein